MQLWGTGKGLDFWSARAAGQVPVEEQRAMQLLAKTTDERRFQIYCRTGAMPALGNMTKRLYLIRRHATILELEDGQAKTSWCMNGGNRYSLPETDHVVVMKALIEGEEYVFRTTGNPSQFFFGSHQDEPPKSVFESSFMGHDGRRQFCRQNEGFADAFEARSEAIAARDAMKREHESARFRQWMAQKARLEIARHGRRLPEAREGPRFIAMDSGGGTGAITLTNVGYIGGQYNGGGVQLANTMGNGCQLTANVGALNHQFAVDVAQQFAAQVDQRVRETLQRAP